MSSPVPYLGSKICLISKSEIRYEGILYTIDAQDSIIALAKVRSFGTEDRPAANPVPARDDVYEYIIFRGTDIKKIEVCNDKQQSMSAIHNDPAIVQSSVQASPFTGAVRHPLGPIGGGAPGYGQSMTQQGIPGGGFGVTQLPPQAAGLAASSQASELVAGAADTSSASLDTSSTKTAASTSSAAAAIAAMVPEPIGPPTQQLSRPLLSSNGNNILDQRVLTRPPVHLHQQSVLQQQLADVMTGSRSPTPNQLQARKSPVSDAGVQVSPPARDGRRRTSRDGPGNSNNVDFQRNRNYNNDDRFQSYDFRNPRDNRRNNQQQQHGPPQGYNNHNQGYNNNYGGGGYNNQGQGQYRNNQYPNQYYGGYQGRGNMGRGGGMGMGPRGGGGMNGAGGGRRTRGGMGHRGGPGGGMLYVSSSRQREDKRLFEKDYDFEQANTQFEELRVQLASTKISSPGGSSAGNNATVEPQQQPSEESEETNGDKDRKEDSGTETSPGDENEDAFYDKKKSFFDKISCEAVERSQGRSQRPDWRLERKINQETFGVATSRRGNYYNRGRGGFYGGGRGGYYRGGYNQGYYRGGMPGGGNYRGGGGGGGGGRGRGGNNMGPNMNGTPGRGSKEVNPGPEIENSGGNNQQQSDSTL